MSLPPPRPPSLPIRPAESRAPRRLALLIASALGTLCGAIGAWADSSAEAATPRGEEPVAVETLALWPPEVRLETRDDRQRLVAIATLAGGVTRDVTAQAEWAFSSGGIAERRGAELVPVADGATELRVRFGGRQAVVPVTVTRSGESRPIRFRLDVVPVFTRAGCNSGACHGASRGKDGFRLSLFGFDPEGDYYRLTREVPGRRVNLALAAESLLLQKATGRVPHTGGERLREGGALYTTLRRWLEAGAPADPPDLPRPVGLDLWPPELVLEGAGTRARLVARARYRDSTDRDVTSLAFFHSSNPSSAAVSPDGVVTAGARGEAFIMARFATFTVGVRVIALPAGLEFAFPEVEERNWIDALVYQKLRKLRIAPSEVAPDEVFLRRAYLDLSGRLPTLQERERFLASEALDKRAKLVDDLLARKEFVDLWVMEWAERLQIRSSRDVSYKAMLLYHEWLQERIASGVPFDRIVRELLSSRGGTFSSPGTNYWQGETSTLKVAENVAQVFLGMRIQCARCHNHPFDRWTQDDYYGFAAFFSQIGRKKAEDPRETIVFDQHSGEVRHPVSGRSARPKFLGGNEPEIGGRDRRAALADWLVSAENPAFARNVANIVWAHFLGRGIVEPVDDARVSNPPVNEPLLEALAGKLVEYRYDLRKLVRDICLSRTYQLSTHPSPTNASDTTNFSRAAVRRLRAEVLLDSLSEVTETKEKFRGLPLGARAVEIADGSTSSTFLTTFGRSRRQSVCSCEVNREPDLSQALHLINGDTIARKIRQGGLVARRLKEGRGAKEITEELWLRTLCRFPTSQERASVEAALADEKDARKGLEDLFWALLNSREFLFNH